MIKVYSMSDLKSFTYTNKFANGNFANGTTGWSASNAVLSVADNIMNITGNGSAANPRMYKSTSVPATGTRKMYARVVLGVTNASCSEIQVYWSGAASGTSIQTISTPTQNNFYTISVVTTTNFNTLTPQIYLAHTYSSAANSNGNALQVKEIFSIDLTDLGYENLSAADCTNIFKFVDGTKQPNFSKTLAT